MFMINVFHILIFFQFEIVSTNAARFDIFVAGCAFKLSGLGTENYVFKIVVQNLFTSELWARAKFFCAMANPTYYKRWPPTL